MVEREMLQSYVWHVERGFSEGFQIARDLMRGLSYSRIPKSYWDNYENEFMRFFSISSCSKSELKKIRKKMVDIIFSEFQEEMYADNYYRLMHALIILDVSKMDKRFFESNEDYMYKVAYGLMEYDDGTAESYEKLHAISWYAAEAAKK